MENTTDTAFNLTATHLSRRDVLKKTILFASGALASPLLGETPKAPLNPVASGQQDGLHLLAFGDFGSKNDNQEIVAKRMAKFARELGKPPAAVLALGDNFYGKMTPDRFARHFEKMYDAEALDCPFYACIGNHDYEKVSYGLKPEPLKFEVQLDYAKNNPGSRWKMPDKWYSFELENDGKALIRFIVLDSNYQEGALTPQEKLAQKRFAEAELSKPTEAPWTWLIWHHPLYTQTTKRKDNNSLIRHFSSLIEQSKPALCLSGHDHNLQHLRLENHPGTSFIISGAGGANTYEVTADEKRGFTRQTLGFNHFYITPEKIEASFIDQNGEILHAFDRSQDGALKVTA